MNGRVTPNFILALLGIAVCVAFMLFLPRLAKAQEPELYLLAFVMAKVQQVYPQVKPFLRLDDCLVEAAKNNAIDPDMKDPRALQVGAAWVCLRVHRVTA